MTGIDDPVIENVPRDAWVLDEAARVIRKRSSKPNGFWLSVLCRMLHDQAEKIRSETPTP